MATSVCKVNFFTDTSLKVARFSPCLSFSATDNTDSCADHFVRCDRLMNGVPYPYLRVRQSRALHVSVAVILWSTAQRVCINRQSLASLRRRRISLLQSTLECRTFHLSLSASTSPCGLVAQLTRSVSTPASRGLHMPRCVCSCLVSIVVR